MTLLHEDVESKKFDVRMIERNVARGVVSSADVQKAVESLPDDAENADYISVNTLLEEGDGGKQA